ncbi:MAG: FAD-binding protein [Deltaproteobacteria bacterium]|nr:FAD-binding protein [Deltaproteobacteria bacterium]MBZ0219518.1 FAD-dependent oxidoreductase [Deltaproteobacteria bacterium]
MVTHDCVIIGAGLAGMRAAIEAARSGLDTALVTKIYPVRSHSVAAQGGINSALKETDSWEAHAFDTVKGSDWLGDQDAIEAMCKEGPGDILELEGMGAIFSRDIKGHIAQRPFGGAGYPRTCYLADRTGHALLHVMYEQVLKHGVFIYDEWHVTRLVVEDGRVSGVIAMELDTGKLHRLRSKSVIMATGGYGRVYRTTTNALSSTGDGLGLALDAGLPLMDMEFVQFHPTVLKRTGILMTEGARGEGGFLLNSLGERFMERYAPKVKELASRDVVSRAEQTEIEEGRGVDGCVFLDLRHLGADTIKSKLSQIRELAMDFAGVDPIEAPVPVKPGAHYSMGGIRADMDGQTGIAGLFAAGECACVSVHGANRLGGNSLLEAVVFGRRAGKKASEYAESAELTPFPDSALRDAANEVAGILKREKGERVYALRDEMAGVMEEHCGIFRSRERLGKGLDKIRDIKERYGKAALIDRGDRFNAELLHMIELGSMLDASEAILVSALNREESRGSHFRTDFPKRNDAEWLKHTLVVKRGNDFIIGYKDVKITRFEPEERKY